MAQEFQYLYAQNFDHPEYYLELVGALKLLLQIMDTVFFTDLKLRISAPPLDPTSSLTDCNSINDVCFYHLFFSL